MGTEERGGRETRGWALRLTLYLQRPCWSIGRFVQMGKVKFSFQLAYISVYITAQPV